MSMETVKAWDYEPSDGKPVHSEPGEKVPRIPAAVRDHLLDRGAIKKADD